MSIAIAYTAQTNSGSWNIVFSEFTSSDIPRTYSGSATFEYSTDGSLVLGGPAYAQKYLWTVDCIISKVKALELDELYRQWDIDRSNLLSAAVGIVDDCWGPQYSGNAIFATAPRFTYLNGSSTLVSLGLQEV